MTWVRQVSHEKKIDKIDKSKISQSLYDVSKIEDMQMHILCLSHCYLIGY